MWLRAMLAAGLMTGALANPCAPSGESAAIAFWDGQPIAAASAPGLTRTSREAIERWETFAERRGYRLDLDESQRILTVSDAERFSVFTPSATTIERTLAALKPYIGIQEGPLVLLRASDETDAQTARTASDALGFGDSVHVMVETGTLTDRRAVDARLSEFVVRSELALFAPHLSVWMADGLASFIAEDVTDRAIIDGEARTLRQARSEVAARRKKDRSVELDLFEIAGVRPGEAAAPLEADAFAVFAFLAHEHGDRLPEIVSRLGASEAPRGEAKATQEARELRSAFGLDVLAHLQGALQRGRSSRR